jgi:hypothetical protein
MELQPFAGLCERPAQNEEQQRKRDIQQVEHGVQASFAVAQARTT